MVIDQNRLGQQIVVIDQNRLGQQIVIIDQNRLGQQVVIDQNRLKQQIGVKDQIAINFNRRTRTTGLVYYFWHYGLVYYLWQMYHLRYFLCVQCSTRSHDPLFVTQSHRKAAKLKNR